MAFEGSFGAVLVKNSYIETAGTANTGKVAKNDISKLDCNRCNLNVVRSVIVNIYALDSDIAVKLGLRLKLKAIRSKVTTEGLGGVMDVEDSQLNIVHVPEVDEHTEGVKKLAFLGSVESVVAIQMKGSSLEAVGNCLPNVDAINSSLNLIGNYKIDAKVINCIVSAEGNYHLKITGKDGIVTVEDTFYHDIRASGGSMDGNASVINKLEISRNPIKHKQKCSDNGGGGDAQDSGADEEREKFTVEFVDRAVITGNCYKLGLFEFTVARVERSHYRVQLGGSEIDEGSLQISEDVGEMVLTASWGGKEQKLKLVSSSVLQDPDPLKMTFDMKIILEEAAHDDDTPLMKVTVDTREHPDVTACTFWDKFMGYFSFP